MSAINSDARPFVRDLPASGIRHVVSACSDVQDLIPLWFGEGDVVTPAFIRDAAKQALDRGATFYTPNLGLDGLRDTIAAYQMALLGVDLTHGNICVTNSGMNALNLVASALVDPGDKVIAITPAWPNLPVVAQVSGAEILRCPLDASSGAWRLDLNKLEDQFALQPRAIVINSPSNPTGWMASEDEIASIVALAARHDSWIIADEVYARIVYEGAIAPSFLAHLETHPKIVAINSFSKAWAMTGWRLGWVTATPELINQLERLMEFNISCAPAFTQIAAQTAIEQGEPYIAASLEQFAASRALLLDRSKSWDGVKVMEPTAAFYAMLQVYGLNDDVSEAKRIARTAGVGLAPGSAFGPEASGSFRLCYATGCEKMTQALDCLDHYFTR